LEKANEYIFKTVAFLRRFSVLEKIEAPLLKGLLLVQLTKYPEDSALSLRIERPVAFTIAEEAELQELLPSLIGCLEDYLAGGVLNCQIGLGGEQNGLMCLVLEGSGEVLEQARESLAQRLNNSRYNNEILHKGNTIQVKILSGSKQTG